VANLGVGDRVVVPFAIACGSCESCSLGYFSCCENSNPNAWLPEKLMGHPTCGAFGYSHLTGGFAGGQAEYVRVPFADVGPLKVPNYLSDEQVLFLSDILPTGYMAAEFCEITPRKVIAVWGAGPVGQFAIASARMLGAERVIAIDRFPYRLNMAIEKAGATDAINYETESVQEVLRDLTAGRGPDACIDAVGLEAHGHGLQFAHDNLKQKLKIQMDRPLAVREAILACRSGGIVSIVGVYAGYVDKFPLGPLMNRGITIKTGQCHVHRYMRPLLERIERGEIDPSFVVSHQMNLDDAAKGYDMFMHKQDEVMKIVLRS
jgi:threonine dehydrogenase-like Zn-dependent dehydrogenase